VHAAIVFYGVNGTPEAMYTQACNSRWPRISALGYFCNHSRSKEISKMRSELFASFPWPARRARPSGARSRRLAAGLETLESRNLLTAGSVVLSPGLITVTPSSAGSNIAIVSYANVNGQKMLDVNLNGNDNYFNPTQVGAVYYMGSGTSGAQTFENGTSVHTVAWGGSGSNLFEGGTGSDEFIGGTGSNTFYAGSGFEVLVGGSGANTYNENAAGLGVISESGTSNTVNVPSGPAPDYQVYDF
jgi:RTX calcium-binding nonapeptide repeat (4 copies)